MGRLLVLTYAAFLILVSYLSSHNPNLELNWFMSASPIWDNLRVGIAIALLVYSLSHYFRPLPIKILFGAGALFMIAVGLAGLLYDTFLSLFPLYLRPVDVFILVEGGVLALLASLSYYEKPALVLAPQPKPEREPGLGLAPEPIHNVSLFFLGRSAHTSRTGAAPLPAPMSRHYEQAIRTNLPTGLPAG